MQEDGGTELEEDEGRLEGDEGRLEEDEETGGGSM